MHTPKAQAPRPWQSDGHGGGTEQASPLQPPAHEQTPSAPQRPWLEQPRGHSASAQSSPAQPLAHTHRPATHAPWPEQWAYSAQLRSAHPAPSQPGSHAHTPAAVQLPCPWQPSGQPATW